MNARARAATLLSRCPLNFGELGGGLAAHRSLPPYRYKYAGVYYRDSNDEHPYCHVAAVRVKQDHAGGGTYSREMYRSSAEDSLIGCPAGAK